MPKQPFVPVQNVLRVRIGGTHQNHPWINGFAIEYDGIAPDNLALVNLAQFIGSTWLQAIGGLLTSATVQNIVQVWDISSDSGAQGVDNTPHNGQGVAGSLLSAGDAVCVGWPVQKRWRGGHFRTYFPARNTSDITNGSNLGAGVKSAYADAAKSFKNTINGHVVSYGPIRLGGVRYYPTGFNADGTPVVKTSGEFLWFSDPVCRTRLDSQRRRLGKEIV